MFVFLFFFHFLFEFGWSTIYLAPSFFAGSPITGRIAGEVYFSTSPSGRQSRRASLPLFVHVSRYYSSCSWCLLIFTLRREKSKAGRRNAARERRTRGGSRATLWLERRKYLNCNGDFDRVEFSGRRCGAGLSFFFFFLLRWLSLLTSHIGVMGHHFLSLHAAVGAPPGPPRSPF